MGSIHIHPFIHPPPAAPFFMRTSIIQPISSPWTCLSPIFHLSGLCQQVPQPGPLAVRSGSLTLARSTSPLLARRPTDRPTAPLRLGYGWRATVSWRGMAAPPTAGGRGSGAHDVPAAADPPWRLLPNSVRWQRAVDEGAPACLRLAGRGLRESAVLPVVLSGVMAASTPAGRGADPTRRNGRSSWDALEWGRRPLRPHNDRF